MCSAAAGKESIAGRSEVLSTDAESAAAGAFVVEAFNDDGWVDCTARGASDWAVSREGALVTDGLSFWAVDMSTCD